ncbi:hypothetical protein GHK29_17020 [Sinorhizobium medicae]|nr:hypothetical protein [Sinorhizobium medicae]MQU76305.1 hypothetical protein [Sinorhizobium medicae]
MFPVIGLAEPMLLEATGGRTPPEDIGRPRRYQEFREALAAPTHGRQAKLVEWAHQGIRAGQAKFAELNIAVDDLAAKWVHKSRRRRRVLHPCRSCRGDSGPAKTRELAMVTGVKYCSAGDYCKRHASSRPE